MTKEVSSKQFSLVKTWSIVIVIEGVTHVGIVISDATELEVNMFK